MDGLPELIQLFVHFDSRMSHGFLGAIDGVCEQVAALADALGVSSILEFDPFELKKITQGFEQFVFLYGFHGSMMRHCSGEYRDAFRQQITTSEMIYSSCAERLRARTRKPTFNYPDI